MRAALILLIFPITALVMEHSSSAQNTPIAVTLRNQLKPGERPSITYKSRVAIASADLELTREEDNKTFTERGGKSPAGKLVTLAFGDQDGGHFHWHGVLVLSAADGSEFRNELKFETGTVGDLHVTYRREKIDLDRHSLQFQLSRPAGKAELRVMGDDGELIAESTAEYAREAPGNWLTISWTPTAGREHATVFRLELRAISAEGLSTRVELTPWSVQVPHEEIVFASGKSDIESSEIKKLETSYAQISKVSDKIKRVDPKLALRLFVAGHTDTVGKPDDNRKLSLARAKSISAYFVGQGLKIGISYAGLGEEALKVPTPDNTDEPQNRRADYILAADKPGEEPAIAGGSRANWVKLQ